MTHQILLPRADGTCVPYILGQASPFPSSAHPSRSRMAYAAAHVVCDPLVESGSASPAHPDWGGALVYRHYLWSLGFSVAAAMDTAHRGMGPDWGMSKELIPQSVTEA